METWETPSAIPRSKLALRVNDACGPIYMYHVGDENKAVGMKKCFLRRKKRLKRLAYPEVIVKKWSNSLLAPLKYNAIYIKIPQ